MITALIERLFFGRHDPSRAKVKQRLKFILAHDRAAITPKMFEEMRKEIMEVVSKYVELDEETLSIDLESTQRITTVIANLPIKALKDETPTVAPPIEFEQLSIELDSLLISELPKLSEMFEFLPGEQVVTKENPSTTLEPKSVEFLLGDQIVAKENPSTTLEPKSTETKSAEANN
jgi:cell division topological specificity factor